ncbi:unnamed protein product [Cutaneotrichosporon oleaginosum]
MPVRYAYLTLLYLALPMYIPGLHPFVLTGSFGPLISTRLGRRVLLLTYNSTEVTHCPHSRAPRVA